MNKITYFGSILNQSQIAEKQQKKNEITKKIKTFVDEGSFSECYKCIAHKWLKNSEEDF